MASTLSNTASQGNAALNATGSVYAVKEGKPTTPLIERAVKFYNKKRRTKRHK